MFDKDAVVNLYRQATFHATDKLSPAAHLSSRYDVQFHGKAMEQRIIDFDVEDVLDLGCATANPLLFFDPVLLTDFIYHGVDINKQFIKLARERWKQFPNLTFAEYDISTMKLPRDYDAIFCNEAFAYFDFHELRQLIYYYAHHANAIFSFTLLVHPEQYPDFLLIQQPRPELVVEYVSKNFQPAVISSDVKNKFIRVDIIRRPARPKEA